MRCPAGRRTGWIALVAASLVAAPVEAAPVALSWSRLPGAESCRDARGLALAVEQRLGKQVFVPPTQAAWTIEGRVERRHAPDGWRAVVSIEDEHGARLGTRELASEAERCDALDEQLTLVVALLIDPDALLAAPPLADHALLPAPAAPPPAAPEIVTTLRSPAPTRTPVLTPAPAPTPAPRAPASPRATFGARIGPAVALGLMPELGLGAELRGHFHPAGWPTFEAGAAVWSPRRVTNGSFGATFSLAYGFIATCPFVVEGAGFSLSPCAGVQLGGLRAGGFGFDISREQEQIVVDVTLGADLRRRLTGPLFAAALAEMAVPLVRDRFFYLAAGGDKRDVFRMAPVAASIRLSLGVELP